MAGWGDGTEGSDRAVGGRALGIDVGHGSEHRKDFGFTRNDFYFLAFGGGGFGLRRCLAIQRETL